MSDGIVRETLVPLCVLIQRTLQQYQVYIGACSLALATLRLLYVFDTCRMMVWLKFLKKCKNASEQREEEQVKESEKREDTIKYEKEEELRNYFRMRWGENIKLMFAETRPGPNNLFLIHTNSTICAFRSLNVNFIWSIIFWSFHGT